MSYYVTLPSNGADLTSEYGKFNNTLTDFEIELKEPLDFPLGNYEVALSEFSYRKTWFFNLGWFTVMSNTHNNMKNEKVFTEKLIDILDGLSVKRVVQRINEVIQNYNPSGGLINTVSRTKPKLTIHENGTLEIFVPLGLKLVMDGYFVEMIRNRSSRPTFYRVKASDIEMDNYLNNNVKF